MNIIDEIDSWIKKEYEETSDPYFHVHDLMRMLDEIRERCTKIEDNSMNQHKSKDLALTADALQLACEEIAKNSSCPLGEEYDLYGFERDCAHICENDIIADCWAEYFLQKAVQ